MAKCVSSNNFDPVGIGFFVAELFINHGKMTTCLLNISHGKIRGLSCTLSGSTSCGQMQQIGGNLIIRCSMGIYI